MLFFVLTAASHAAASIMSEDYELTYDDKCEITKGVLDGLRVVNPPKTPGQLPVVQYRFRKTVPLLEHDFSFVPQFVVFRVFEKSKAGKSVFCKVISCPFDERNILTDVGVLVLEGSWDLGGILEGDFFILEEDVFFGNHGKVHYCYSIK